METLYLLVHLGKEIVGARNLSQEPCFSCRQETLNYDFILKT